jgi:signal transduction histidine kinase
VSKRYDDARRGIEAASQALARLRQESGAPEGSHEGDAAAAAGLRAALDATRRALEEKARELESARARVRELERERAELLDRAAGSRPDEGLAERAQRAEAEAMKVKQAAASDAAAMNGRLSMQQAEFVRLNSLRRKAEEAVEQSELTRREVEEALRRDLRTVHSALDRAAAEAGAREARAQSDIAGLTRRLEAALTRTEQLSREQQQERDRWRAERARLAVTLQRASAVHASLRRELEDLRRGLDLGVEEIARRLSVSEDELAKARAGHDGRVSDLTRRLAESEAERSEPLAARDARIEELSRRLFAAEMEKSKALSASAQSGRLAAAEADLLKARAAQGQHAEQLARRLAAMLVARLKPGAAAAYDRLRELSSIVPLSEAESSSLRRAASALAGLCDGVGVVERYLDDGPSGEPGPLAPAITRAAGDWEAALNRKGCRLSVKLGKNLGAAVFDPADLRLVLDQLLRRAFDTLPARCKLELSARREGKTVEVVLEDNGPGMSSREAAAAFDPGPEDKGLALPLARRVLRRWGGDARLEQSPAGSGRLILTLRAV